MTVNDVLEKLYKIDKILDHLDGEWKVNREELEGILEDYKAMLCNLKVKE